MIVTGSSVKTAEAAKPTLPCVDLVVADQADPEGVVRLLATGAERVGSVVAGFCLVGVSDPTPCGECIAAGGSVILG